MDGLTSRRLLRRGLVSQQFRREVLARYRGDHTILEARRQLVGPLVIGLRRYAHCLGGGRGSAAKQSGSFGFLHAPIKAFFN